jgi:hypothetical protein
METWNDTPARAGVAEVVAAMTAARAISCLVLIRHIRRGAAEKLRVRPIVKTNAPSGIIDGRRLNNLKTLRRPEGHSQIRHKRGDTDERR